MTSSTPRDLLERLDAGYCLPPLSPVAFKLVELASDDSCSVRDLARVIESDPALVVRLLKLANSPFYRSIHPAATLSQAITKVGFDRLRIMALSVSIRQAFPLGRIGPFDYGKFWRISTYRALICRALAAHLDNWNPEEAFISGLLMEIGLPIFFDLFIRGKQEAVDLEPEPLERLLEWERECHGVDHRQIGEAALTFWKFPPQIIASQKILPNAPDEAPLASLCCMARSFSRGLFYSRGDFQAVFKEAERSFGLGSAVVNEILMTIFDQVSFMADALRVEIKKERDLVEIMEKANRCLGRLSEKISELSQPNKKCGLPSFDSLDDGQEAVSQTLQAVAHEIRNPLLAIGGFTRRLASSLDPASEEGKYVKIILAETAKLEAALSGMTGSYEGLLRR